MSYGRGLQATSSTLTPAQRNCKGSPRSYWKLSRKRCIGFGRSPASKQFSGCTRQRRGRRRTFDGLDLTTGEQAQRFWCEDLTSLWANDSVSLHSIADSGIKGAQLATPKKKREENAASVFKAIALKTLSTGKFWQFGWFVILGLLIWRTESSDLVKIAKLFVESPVFTLLGWLMFALTSISSAVVFKALRKAYSAELDRVVGERNELQKQLTNGNITSSSTAGNTERGKKK